jgi:guanylate cyclase
VTTAGAPDRFATRRIATLAHRLVSIADEPDDDDDVRLRKRVGVVVGYVHVVLPFILPLMTQGEPLSWVVALTMPLVSALNLAALARTHRFEPYVLVLIVMVMTLPVVVEMGLGGLQGSSAAILFAFLGPVYAILALGPRRATIWFVVFAVGLAVVILLDPLVSSRVTPHPYEERLLFYWLNLVVPLGLTFILLRYTDLRRREEKERAEEILTNAIPVAIATRLKRGERRIAEAYPEATVLFSDLAGFTGWARTTEPDEVVAALDALFSRFDRLAAETGVEKIKTIGDAYMAVAGVPRPRVDHADAAVALGLGMLGAVEEARRERRLPLALRIGLASGSVVGGVIGERRLLFDLWGDTVNLAKRMESSGIAGRLHLAASTRDRLNDRFLLEERAPAEVKGMGRMTTYLLVNPAGAAAP